MKAEGREVDRHTNVGGDAALTTLIADTLVDQFPHGARELGATRRVKIGSSFSDDIDGTHSVP